MKVFSASYKYEKGDWPEDREAIVYLAFIAANSCENAKKIAPKYEDFSEQDEMFSTSEVEKIIWEDEYYL